MVEGGAARSTPIMKSAHRLQITPKVPLRMQTDNHILFYTTSTDAPCRPLQNVMPPSHM